MFNSTILRYPLAFLLLVLSAFPCYSFASPAFSALLSSKFETKSKDDSAVVVRFCVPNSDIYPFYFTVNNRLTGFNAEVLNQLFTPENFPNVKLELVRLPWKRCVAALANSEVDMMIGGYNEEYENLVFPFELGFEFEESVISTVDVCFFSLEGEQMQRTRDGMRGEGLFIVGIEAGFSKRIAMNITPRWLELYNPLEKYSMLQKGRVDAIIQICAMDGVPIKTVAETMGFNDFQMFYPPYLTNHGYAVFSESFARQHEKLAKRIISLSTKVDKKRIYESLKSPGN